MPTPSFPALPSSSSPLLLPFMSLFLGIIFHQNAFGNDDANFAACCRNIGLSPASVKDACRYPPLPLADMPPDEYLDVATKFSDYIGCYAGHSDNRDCCHDKFKGMFVLPNEQSVCQDLCDGLNPPHDAEKYLKPCHFGNGLISSCNERARHNLHPLHDVPANTLEQILLKKVADSLKVKKEELQWKQQQPCCANAEKCGGFPECSLCDGCFRCCPEGENDLKMV